MTADIAVRAATPADLPLILSLIRELAAYERAPDSVLATEELLERALFGPAPVAHAEIAAVDGAAVGFAVWYVSFSTWTGRAGLWLEDLFVRPDARRRGVATALLRRLAGICAERGYPRFEWSVLDWNAPAHGFHRGLGARPQEEWTVWRLDGAALQALGTLDR